MRKKNKKIVFAKLEATLIGHERFNAYQGGYGVHKSEKYPNRSKRKQTERKEIEAQYKGREE